MNYLSGEKVQGIPYELPFDFYGEEKKLGTTEEKMALLSDNKEYLRRWVEGCGLDGNTYQFGPRYLFLPSRNPPPPADPHQVIQRLRACVP